MQESPRPEDVVGDKEASPAQTRDCQVERLGVTLLVNIIQDDVKWAVEFFDNFEGIPDSVINHAVKSAAPEISQRPVAVLLGAVGADYLSVVAQAAGEPVGRVAESRAHLENAPGAGGNCQLPKKRPHYR